MEIIEGKGGFPFLEIHTPQAKAEISLYGGQVLSYQPVNSSIDLLYLSPKAYFEQGKAIKGGIPVCWPWFADQSHDKSLPFHGFVRNRLWSVKSSEVNADESVTVRLSISSDETSRAMWPYEFELEQVITVGTELSIELVTHNTGDKAFTITQALHTYFQVGSIHDVSVSGLDNKTYLDKVEGFVAKQQSGDVIVHQEVDRIYQQVRNPITIHDNSLSREIFITSRGSATTVVWNPWKLLSAQSKDLADDSYLNFICVETTNASDDVITIDANASHTLSVSYQIK